MKRLFGAQSFGQEGSLCTKGVFCAQSRPQGVTLRMKGLFGAQSLGWKGRKLGKGRNFVHEKLNFLLVGYTANEKKW